MKNKIAALGSGDYGQGVPLYPRGYTTSGAAAVDPIAPLANAGAYNPGGGPPAVAGPIDTTGATLFVVAGAFVNGLEPTLTDSEANTWTGLTIYLGGSLAVRLYYVLNPLTDPAQTFSYAGTTSSLAVAAFDLVGSYDQESGAGSASSTTQQPGSLTPGAANSLLVTGLEFIDGSDPGAATINSGFTLLDAITNPPTGVAVALAYKVQTAAEAVNPTWASNVAAERISAAMASFLHV